MIYLLILVSPFLIVVYTDRGKRRMTPDQYAVLFAIGCAVGILIFVPAISVVAATGLLALGIARLSARLALNGVSYSRQLSPNRLFPGDEADLVLRLENRKLLPLASVAITDPVHYSLVRSDQELQDLVEFSGGIQVLENLS